MQIVDAQMAMGAKSPERLVRLNVIQSEPNDTFLAVKGIKTVADFENHLRSLGIYLPIQDRIKTAKEGSPLAQPFWIGNFKVGNRCCIQPMEGWDGTRDGKPTDRTFRRWRRFGQSGAKLIWGGEAFAVVAEGRANPLQLHHSKENEAEMKRLYDELIRAHEERFGIGSSKDLFVGLQLTHSGRFCKPTRNDVNVPRVMYRHPILDKMFGVKDDSSVLSDDEIENIIQAYVDAVKMAERIGFNFVDIKACHGYLLHESLSAYDRPDKYGGDFTGRTLFLRTIIKRIRKECPKLKIGVRLSAYDTIPYKLDSTKTTKADSKGTLEPMSWDASTQGQYPGFGLDRDDPSKPDLSETVQLLKKLRYDPKLKVDLVNITAGSPYYSALIQRPAYKPPGKAEPSENPLVGVARQIYAVRALKEELPDLPIVGTGYTALQEYLPYVAQAVVDEEWVDFVGYGRGALAYHDLFADILEGNKLKRRLFCRTLSECTDIIRATDPVTGLPLGNSGCLPFDGEYRQERTLLR